VVISFLCYHTRETDFYAVKLFILTYCCICISNTIAVIDKQDTVTYILLSQFDCYSKLSHNIWFNLFLNKYAVFDKNYISMAGTVAKMGGL